jgi:hypothetical protein
MYRGWLPGTGNRLWICGVTANWGLASRTKPFFVVTAVEKQDNPRDCIYRKSSSSSLRRTAPEAESPRNEEESMPNFNVGLRPEGSPQNPNLDRTADTDRIPTRKTDSSC